jgi:hypothetical protein
MPVDLKAIYGWARAIEKIFAFMQKGLAFLQEIIILPALSYALTMCGLEAMKRRSQAVPHARGGHVV